MKSVKRKPLGQALLVIALVAPTLLAGCSAKNKPVRQAVAPQAAQSRGHILLRPNRPGNPPVWLEKPEVIMQPRQVIVHPPKIQLEPPQIIVDKPQISIRRPSQM